MMAPTTPQAAVFQAWFSSNPRARARRAMSHAPTKQPSAMPTPCGENCTGPMPILGMTFQPIMAFRLHPMAASGWPVIIPATMDLRCQAMGTMRSGRLDLGWEGMTDDLRDLRAVHRSEGPRLRRRMPGRLHLRG